MEQGIITGVLAVSLAFLNPSSVTHINTTSEQTQQMWDYHVKEGDSLGSIAQEAYGSSDYWTTVWNDNSFLENPDLIEEGMIIKIKIVKPTAPDVLKEELANGTSAETVAQTQIAAVQTNNVETQAQTPTTTPTPTAPVVQTSTDNPLNMEQITFLGNCEAGMNPTRNSGNGYYGAFQFSYGTWKSMGTEYERADLAPIEVQIEAVQRLLKRSSIFHQFPGCARKMQAMGIL